MTMQSFEALRVVAPELTNEDLIVITSTGRLKNEWYCLMPGDGTMFLPLMGGALPFGLGMALALPHRRIVAIDTDGSLLFDPAPLCTIANELPADLTVLVFDNEMYESIGGPPTHTSRNVDIERLARGAGIPRTGTAREPEEMTALLRPMLADGLPGLIVAKVAPGAHPDLEGAEEKRSDFAEDKYRFIRHVEQLENITIRAAYVAD